MFFCLKNSQNNRRQLVVVFVVLFLSLSLPSLALAIAGVPQTMSYQGRLANSDGDLVGGAGTTYYFKFSLWDDASAGSQVWPVAAPGATTATVRHGLFNVNIGDTVGGYPDALNYDFSLNNKIYLQVEVSSTGGAGTYETLTPRQPLTSSPFAQIAGSVYGSGVSTMGGLIVNGNSTTTNSTTTGSSYLGTSAGLNGVYISDWTDLASFSWSTSSANIWGLSKNYLAFGTTSDALTEGIVNLFWMDSRFDTRLAATTSLSNLATLAGLTTIGSSTGATNLLGSITALDNFSITGLTGNIITSTNVKTSIQDLDTRLYNSQNTTKEQTGFPNRTDTSIAFNDSTRDFTITGTNFKFYVAGKEYTKSTESIGIPVTAGLYYIYYDKTTGNLATTTTAWSLTDGTVQVATVYWDGANGLLGEERHGLIMDGQTHEYLHTTVGSRYNSGLTGTFSSPPTFSVTGGSVYDEDILNSTTTTQTTTRVLYRSGSTFIFTAPQANYYHEVSNIIQYDNAGTVTPVGANNYVAYWIFATNDPNTPVYSLMGQRQDTTVANARTNNTYESLSLTNLPFKEMKLLYRVILRRNGTSETYQETQDLRSVSNLPSGTYVATAHGILTGLLNDDHAQYALLAGRNGGQIFYGSDLIGESLSLFGNSINGGNIFLQSAGGSVSVGTTSNITAGSYLFNIASTTSTTGLNYFTITNAGLIGIGTSTPSNALEVNGSGYFTGNLWGANITATGTLAALGTLTVSGTGSSTIASDFIVDTNTFYVDTVNNRIGMGTNNPSARLHFVDTDTANTGTVNGAYFVKDMKPTSNQTGGRTALYGFNQTDNATAWNYDDIRGLSFTVDHRGSGTVNLSSGAQVYAGNSGAGLVNYAYGILPRITNTGVGTTTNGYAIYVDNPSVTSGSLTNNYALYLAGQTAGASNYAIYSNGGQSYFKGNIGIGSTTPTQELSIVGATLGSDSTISMGVYQNRPWEITAKEYNSATAGYNLDISPQGYNGNLLLGTNGSYTTNVGIGTTTPSNKLEVAGSGYFTGNLWGANLTATGTLTALGILTVSGTGSSTIASDLGIDAGTFYVDTVNNRIGIGTTTPGAQLEIVNQRTAALGGADRGISITQNVSAIAQAQLNFKRSRGTSAAPTTVNAADSLSGIWNIAHDGTSYLQGVSGISWLVKSAATNDVRTDLLFTSNPAGASSATAGEKMRLTWDGMLGIGTTSPTSLLNVVGTLGSTTPLFTVSSTTAANIISNIFTVLHNGRVGIASSTPYSTLSVSGITGTDPFTVASSSGNSMLTVSANGNIGINEPNPTSKLTVQQSVDDVGNGFRIKEFANPNNYFEFYEDGATGGVLRASASGGTERYDLTMQGYKLHFQTYSGSFTDRITVLNTGNVGINQTNPAQLFTVYGTKNAIYSTSDYPTGNQSIWNYNNAQTSGQYSSLHFQVTSNNGSNNAYGYLTLVQPTYNNSASDFAFTLRNSAGAIGERVRIKGDGTMGIGTTTPLAKLDLAGTLGNTQDLFNVSSTTASNVVASLFKVESTGHVGIGTSTPSSALEVAGSGYFTGDLWGANLTATGTLTALGALTVSGTGTSTIAGDLAVDTNTLYVDSINNRVGIGTNAPTANLTISDTDTSNTGATNSFNATKSMTPTTNQTGAKTTLYGLNRTDPATSWNYADIRGLSFAVDHRGGGTVTSASGMQVFSGNSGAGDITSSYGVYSQITQTGAGTTANAYGVYILNPYKEAGTITNNYGLHIRPQIAGTNNWAIYSAGGKSYFTDSVGLGVDTPTKQLEVASSTDASIFIRRSSTATGDYAQLLQGVSTNQLAVYSAVRTTRLASGYGRLGLMVSTTTLEGGLAEFLSILHTGQVGIGTTSPSNTLEVNGSGYFTGNLWGANITATGTLTALGALTVSGTGTSTIANGLAVDTDTLYVDSVNNRVAIGTTTPNKKFSIFGSNGAVDATFTLGVTSARNWNITALAYNANNTYSMDISPVAYAGNLTIGTNYSYVTRLGLGTTTPSSQLSIHSMVGGAAATSRLLTIASSTSAGLATTTLITVLGNGYLGLGNDAPASRLTVSETVGGKGVFSFNPPDTTNSFTMNASGQLTAYSSNAADWAAFGTGLTSDTYMRLVFGLDSSNPFVGFGPGTGGRDSFMKRTLNGAGFSFTGGNVGIGTTSPAANLAIHSLTGLASTNLIFTIASSTSGGAATTTLFKVDGAGNVTVASLTADGTVCSSGGILTNTCPSSQTYKDNIADTQLNIDNLLKLQVKSFTWKRNGQADFGLIAEEIQQFLPEIYSESNGIKGYRTDHLPFYLLQIAQRQEKQIESLQGLLGGLSIGPDGSLYVKKLNAEEILVERGVTIKDRATGQNTCVYVENGAIKTSLGECSTSIPAPTPSGPTEPVITDPIVAGTSTEPVATEPVVTEPVIPTEPTSTPSSGEATPVVETPIEPVPVPVPEVSPAPPIETP